MGEELTCKNILDEVDGYEEDSYLADTYLEPTDTQAEITFDPICFKKGNNLVDWALLIEDNNKLISDIIDIDNIDPVENENNPIEIFPNLINNTENLGSTESNTWEGKHLQDIDFFPNNQSNEPSMMIENQYIHCRNEESSLDLEQNVTEPDRFEPHSKLKETQNPEPTNLVHETVIGATRQPSAQFTPISDTSNNPKECQPIINTNYAIPETEVQGDNMNENDCINDLVVHHLETIQEDEKEDMSNLDILVDLIEKEAEGEKIDSSNKGFELLESMGWTPGEGIGRKPGIKVPIGQTDIRTKGDKRPVGAPVCSPRKQKAQRWQSPNAIKNRIEEFTEAHRPLQEGESWYFGQWEDNDRTKSQINSLYAEMKLWDQTILALIDTGASTSVLTSGILKHCPEGSFQPNNTDIKGIGNASIKTLGLITADCKIDNLDLSNQKFLVVNDKELPVEAVLGLDLLIKNQLTIDPIEGYLYSKDTDNRIRLIPKYKYTTCNTSLIYLAEETTIPSFSRTYILGKSPYDCWEEKDVLFDKKPDDDFPEGVLMGRCVGTMQDQQILIPIINTNHEPIVINPGCKLGELTAVEVKENKGETEKMMWLESDWDTNSLKPKTVSHMYDLNHIKEGKEAVEELLNKYHAVTSQHDYDVGRCTLQEMHIDTGDHQPIYIPPRRMSPIVKQKLKVHINSMHKAGIIGKSNSSWSFPLVPVLKKNGEVRPCADLREINKISRWEAHPLPNLSECIVSLKGSKLFTSLDLNKGFMQLFLDEESSNKCSFPFDGTLWKFHRVPFGLKSAPGWFQLQMNTVLSGFTPEEVLIYLDDFLLHSPNLESHLELLEKVLQRLQTFGLKIRPNKCEILKTEVDYLGHKISESGISPLAKSVDKIKNYPRPTNCRAVRRLVGMANWYRDFCKDFSTIVRPLTNCMSKQIFVWNPQCEEAFEKVKNLFSSEDVLTYPDYLSDNPLILTCDASAYGAGGVLTQVQENKEKIISYFSKSFNDAQSKYSAFDKELTSIRMNLEHFKPHILGKKVIIRTDHKPIVHLSKNKVLSSRLHRIYEILGTYDIQIEFVPGRSNNISDALSRAFEEKNTIAEMEPVILPDNMIEYPIPGGGDSLLRAVSLGLYNDTNKHEEVRKKLFNTIRSKPCLYGLTPKQISSIEFKRLGLIGEPALSEHLPNIAKIFNIKIIMHQGGTPPIIYNMKGEREIHIINRDNVHFNGVTKVNEEQIRLVKEIPTLRISPNIKIETLKKWQEEDEILTMLKEAKVNNKNLAGVNPEVKGYLKHWDKIYISGDLLTYKIITQSCGETFLVPIIPESKTSDLISEAHIGLNHIGRNKVFEYIKSYFFFKGMRDTIGQEIKKCLACKMYKDNIERNDATFLKVKSDEPFEKLHLDLAEMQRSRRGHKYFLVAVDHYSKWAFTVALKNKEASTLVNCLEKIILPACHVLPQTIISDNGREFKNRDVAKLLSRYGIQQDFSPAFFPQNNGLAERTINTIKSLLRTSGGDWESILPQITMTYNSTYHESINRSPAEVFTGRTAKVVVPDKDFNNIKSHIPFKVGDRVLRKVNQPTKMGIRYQPGYKISRVNANNRTYGVLNEDDPGSGEIKIHHNQLRLQVEDPGTDITKKETSHDIELRNLKTFVNMTVKPNWDIVPSLWDVEKNPKPETTLIPARTDSPKNAHDNTLIPPVSPAETQFSGFEEMGLNLEQEVRRRASCRKKNPIERYGY